MKYRTITLLVFTAILFWITSCGKKEATRIDNFPSDTPVEDIASVETQPIEKPSRDLDRNIFDNAAADKEAIENLSFEVVYFGLDESSLTPRARNILSKHGDLMKQYPSVSLMIEGHCDERGTIEYNLALGERRAVAVKNYLINYGIDQSRLYTISYGKERPAEQGHNEEAWALNRRAVFQIVGQ